MIYTTDKIKDVVKPIAQKYGVESIYLFGSYARGEGDKNSDLDFCLLAEITTDGSFYSNIMNEKLNVA